ncbi:hypothetical protein [Jatrophihabitans sp.]|uniref:hypothetical protein n=1 Tax=Jatrophihabitans sp. TaxID=1932789 RepID=UPI0030C686FE|nr:hypothetical protein [Jatrophihabitans sp.]
MTSSIDAAILPITLTVNGRIGLTLWAPPWEDDEGEEWQGFLGDGAKILLYPGTRELAAFIVSGEENDLSDHPAWGYVMKLTPDQLRPSPEDNYDLDAVYEWAAGEPDPVHVSSLADVVDMVAKIADCCDDGGLRSLVEGTPAFAELVDEENTYQGKEGRKRWNELGDTIASSWERAIGRVESWLSWQGDFSSSDLDSQTIWDRIGAEPLSITVPGGVGESSEDVTYLTVRGYLNHDTGDDVDAAFIGGDDTVAVFTDVADLAQYCRTATEHQLVALEWWSELSEVSDDADFEAGLDAAYDLRKPSAKGADLLRELAVFCNLDLDLSVLDSGKVADLDRDDWRDLVREVASCFTLQD